MASRILRLYKSGKLGFIKFWTNKENAEVLASGINTPVLMVFITFSIKERSVVKCSKQN